MANKATMVVVVAMALIGPDGRVLMQRRRRDRAHGGLWEFPGGKIEPGETPQSAALREIAEELGVELDAAALRAVGFAADTVLPPAPRQPHVILLYTCWRWQGQPQCLDGEEIGWFIPAEISALAMPPLDYPLAEALVRSLDEGG